MARSGSFGTSLNPFGAGTLGNLGQYSIGDNLKDLEAYKLEIAWGNGEITDAEYQASLAKLVAAADPGTTAQLSAQNKLDDVTYRIGRSQANAAGLDSLIAFDQQSLSGMDPANLKYRDVKSNLDSELANRRSRDYGKLVAAYNAGDTSTESLLAWVQNTLASLPSDASDRDNWDSVNATLTSRIVDEKDAQIYQDYQDRKLSPADFLAYLTGRRDAVDPSSPQWDTANQRLLDAEKNVNDTVQAARDQDVADKYTNGKISDATYLLYLKKRVEGLDPGDPDLPTWKQRFTQAAHSLAEDKLRSDVSLAKTQAAQNTAAANLRSFYKAYALTLNPGSAEYRATMVSINALKPTASGGGGGGKATVTTGGGPFVDKTGKVPKIILPTASFDAALGMLTPDAHSPKKDQATAVAALRMNLQSATAAVKDKVWLYYDPRYPGQTVTAQNPDGTVALDAKGKSFQVRGSSYRATSSDEIARMQEATATYSFALADIAYAKGDVKAGDTAMWHGNIAMDSARTTQAHAVLLNTTAQLDSLQKGIDTYTKLNDPASAHNLLVQQARVLRRAMLDGSLDQGQTDALQKKLDTNEANPLASPALLDIQGDPVKDAAGHNIQAGGLLNMAASPTNSDGSLVSGAGVYAPDVHFELGTNASGGMDWGPKLYKGAPGTYEQTHIQVQTGTVGVPVTGWVPVSTSAGLTHGFYVTTAEGRQYIPVSLTLSYFSYVVDGARVDAYSLDEKTWVLATGGMLPDLQINTTLTKTIGVDGAATLSGPDGAAIFKSNADQTAWGGDPSAAIAAGAVGWFGQKAAESRGDVSEGVGRLGQQFRLVTSAAGPDGTMSLNLVPAEIIYKQQMFTRTLENPSGARQTYTRTLENPSGATPGTDRTSGGGTWGTPSGAYTRTLENPSGTTPFAVGAFASSLLRDSRLPAATGIVHLGATPMPAITPPTSLPPVTAASAFNSVFRSVLGPIAAPTLKKVSTAPPAVTDSRLPVAPVAKLASTPVLRDSRLPVAPVATAASNLLKLRAKTGGGQ